jgi:hypothetical protein
MKIKSKKHLQDIDRILWIIEHLNLPNKYFTKYQSNCIYQKSELKTFNRWKVGK